MVVRKFPKTNKKLKIVIPFKSRFSLALIKFFFGIKLYEFLAGSKNLGESSMSKQIKYDLFALKITTKPTYHFLMEVWMMILLEES